MSEIIYENDFTSISSYFDYCKRKNAIFTSPATLKAFNNENNLDLSFYFRYKTENGTYYDTGLIASKTDVATVLRRLHVPYFCTLIGII